MACAASPMFLPSAAERLDQQAVLQPTAEIVFAISVDHVSPSSESIFDKCYEWLPRLICALSNRSISCHATQSQITKN